MIGESGQAGATLSDDQVLERVNRFRDDLSDLNKRWQNRLILEGRSLAEAYVNRHCGVVLYGDVPQKTSDCVECLWACSISRMQIIAEAWSTRHGNVDAGYVGDCDGRNKEVMFIVVVEIVEPPKVLVRSVLRPYLFEKRFLSSRDGFLYQRKDRSGFEVFPFGMNGEVFFSPMLDAPANPCRQMVERGTQIMGRVSDYQRQQFGDWLQRAVVNIQPGFLKLGKDRVLIECDLVEASVQGLGESPEFIKVAVGPFNL